MGGESAAALIVERFGSDSKRRRNKKKKQRRRKFPVASVEFQLDFLPRLSLFLSLPRCLIDITNFQCN